jgi:DNA-binding transcriptional LysR family regulator
MLYILRMNVASLDLNLLVALDALLQAESVSRGGHKIGLSQPAMSHALGKLRGLLGDPLLVRTGGRMQLTLRAQSMKSPVRETLERVREVFVSDSFVPASSTRTFRIFMSDYASNLLLSPLSRAVQRSAPGVRIEVHPWRGVPADSPENGQIPDAVVACQTRDLPGFYRQRLFTDRDVCVMRAGHRLHSKKFNLKTFLEAPQVAVAAVEFSADPVDTWLQEVRHPRCVVVTVPHYIDALHLVAQTELIAVIPEFLARAYASTLNLVTKTVPLDVGTFDEYLLHSARTHADVGCSWLRELIKSLSPGPGGVFHVHGLPTTKFSPIPTT